MGSWKGRGNQYIEFARVLYCKLPTNGKQLPAFPLEPVRGSNPGLRGLYSIITYCIDRFVNTGRGLLHPFPPSLLIKETNCKTIIHIKLLHIYVISYILAQKL